jgi:hypothetical protein
MKKNRIISSFLHILLFVVVEILFVFLILKEFPEVSFFEDLWIIHLAYWISIFVAWFTREHIKSYQVKFLFSYIPVVFHIVWHIYIWEITLEQIESHSISSDFWLIISTICAWVIIFIWEYLLHRKYHCEHNHDKVHKHCKED